jgi:PilZ domain-containing protein
VPAQEPADRRKQPRLPRRLPARFGTDAKMSGGTVVDVSEGGMRLESPDAYPVNSIILVFVQFPRHSVRLRARVAWASGKGSGNPAMGLTFTQPEPNLAKAYKEWAAEIKLMASEKPEPGPKPEPEEKPAEAAAPAEPPKRPEPTGPIRRRMESRQGQPYEALLERCDGGWRLTIVQMPRQGVGAPDFQGTYKDHPSAETALREFVRSH